MEEEDNDYELKAEESEDEEDCEFVGVNLTENQPTGTSKEALYSKLTNALLSLFKGDGSNLDKRKIKKTLETIDSEVRENPDIGIDDEGLDKIYVQIIETTEKLAKENPKFTELSKFLRQYKIYFFDVAILKVGCAVALWVLTKAGYDSLVDVPDVNNWDTLLSVCSTKDYWFRNLAVGVGGSIGAQVGSLFADISNGLLGIPRDSRFGSTQSELLCLVFMIDSFWQFEFDLSTCIANSIESNPSKVVSSAAFLMAYLVTTGLSWHGLAKLIKAPWNDKTISAQIYFMAVFFALPSLFWDDPSVLEDTYLCVLFSCCGALAPPLARTAYEACHTAWKYIRSSSLFGQSDTDGTQSLLIEKTNEGEDEGMNDPQYFRPDK